MILMLKKRKGLTRAQKDDLVGWLFVLPIVIGTILFLIPIVFESVRFSFYDLKMEEIGFSLTPVGWENYKTILFVDPNFVRNIITFLSSLLLSIPSIIIFSLFIAVLLNKYVPGRTLFRFIFFIPVILSVGYFETVMSGDVMTSAMSSLSSFDSGVSGYTGFFTTERISQYLMELNITTSITDFLVNLLNGIPTVINHSGVQILVFLAGLQSISPSIYEAAQIEGATGWESFWKITFPMISPMILVNLIYSIIDEFTRSSNTIMQSIKDTTFGSFKFGQGSAMAWFYFAVIIVVLIVVALIASRVIFYQERD